MSLQPSPTTSSGTSADSAATRSSDKDRENRARIQAYYVQHEPFQIAQRREQEQRELQQMAENVAREEEQRRAELEALEAGKETQGDEHAETSESMSLPVHSDPHSLQIFHSTFKKPRTTHVRSIKFRHPSSSPTHHNSSMLPSPPPTLFPSSYPPRQNPTKIPRSSMSPMRLKSRHPNNHPRTARKQIHPSPANPSFPATRRSTNPVPAAVESSVESFQTGLQRRRSNVLSQ